MDDSSYVAGGASMVSTNTKIATSTEDLAAITKKTADAQVASILRVREASKLRIASLQNIAANAPNLETQTAATVALQREQAKLSRTYGQTTVATAGFSRASKTAEGDLSKVTRGALAGTGVFSTLGRSLAFASNAFIGLAIGAEVIKGSITAAEDLEKAQKSLGVAIQHTGGNVKALTPQYEATAKAAAQFGISQADATTGLARATVLTGNAAAAQRAYQEALVISKATGKDFNAVLTATSKGQEGITTSLRRYGILVAKGETGTQQFTQVMQRFGGQAEANTTASEKFRAVLVNTGATIGAVLLPTFVRLTTNLTNYLQKANESGRLQKDVASAAHDLGDAFHVLEGALRGVADVFKAVDKVTGSFKNTLEVLLALKFASVVTGTWIPALASLAAKWGLVTGAAEAATAAQTTALASSAGGAARAAGVVAGAEGAAGGAAAVAGPTIGALAAPLAIVGTGALLLSQSKEKSYSIRGGKIFQSGTGQFFLDRGGRSIGITRETAQHLISSQGIIADSPGVITAAVAGGNFASPFTQLSGISPRTPSARGGGPFGAARPIALFKSFTDTIANQLAAARAALTKGTSDDVAAAKATVAFVKKEIAAGHLSGSALIQALQAEASAVSTIQSIEAAAAQKRAAAAQAAKAKIQAQIEASIDPLRLEVALSRDEALGRSTRKDLIALKRAAQKALRSGHLSLEQQKEAYDQITQINSQLASLNKTTKKTAKDALGGFKQLNLNALTGNLGLTPTQRKALKARLSQVGPHGTVPNEGVGAYGYRIGANDRPIHVHTTIDIDGRKVARNTTRHQQRYRAGNSSQRRGPNAGG